MRPLRGWLFDVYPAPGKMVVWIIDEGGRIHRLQDQIRASFFVEGGEREWHAIADFVQNRRYPATTGLTWRYELFHRREIQVLQISVHDPARFQPIVKAVTTFQPDLQYYNCDLSLAQRYCFQRETFPLARCCVLADAAGNICGWQTEDSPWALEYPLPPMRILKLSPASSYSPQQHWDGKLLLEYGDRRLALPADDLSRLARLLTEYDPDLLISDWGDSFILPHLERMAAKQRLALPLNRDLTRPPQHRPAHSYFSYGRIVHWAESTVLFGRWHIDRRNAFLIEDYYLDGIYEIARLTAIPVQRVARTSTGSGISAMEVSTAYRQRILIPWQKREPEAFKTALGLLNSDKGGLVFQPIVGLHENVGELDFVSMYPTIMTRFNISPETVNCPCCHEAVVPELGYTICRRRRGLVPLTLDPLIDKRRRYKAMIRRMPNGAPKDLLKRRQSAHKWLLVTCFGYLGYKNARFGKIEAHEAVTAYGRELLLQAKEVAEAEGYRMLHAIVDSLWLHKEGADKVDYRRLGQKISETTGLSIELEGVYRWLAFLPSRVDARVPVANRYYGAFEDGELKVRGIEARRGDTPLFIKAAQLEMLGVLSAAPDAASYQEMLPQALAALYRYLQALWAGKVDAELLAIRQRLSKAPEAYRQQTLGAIAARQLMDRGVKLNAGESLRYVILAQAAAQPEARAVPLALHRPEQGYDIRRYTELLLRAAETLFTPLGINARMLREWAAASRLLGAPATMPLAVTTEMPNRLAMGGSNTPSDDGRQRQTPSIHSLANLALKYRQVEY